jgi:hypothetical protein
MAVRVDAKIKFFSAKDGGRETAPPSDGSYRAFLKVPNGDFILSRLVSAAPVRLGVEETTTWELIAPLRLIDPRRLDRSGVPDNSIANLDADHFSEVVHGATLTVSEGIAAVGVGSIIRRYGALLSKG